MPTVSTTPTTALLREVSPRLAEVELTFLDRLPMDLEVARDQHEAYRQLLTDLGLEIVLVPPAPELPDAVFVEDAVVVVEHLAILTRPGAPSRRPEVADVRGVVEHLGLEVATIEAPATLDGGDVLQMQDTVYVGLSSRTNEAALEQLTALVSPLGRRVVGVTVTGALHLRSVAAATPDGTVLAVSDCIDVAAFDATVEEAPERSGANLLLVGETVVVSASAPATAARLADRGFAVVTCDISELEKAEAGLTCMSVLI